MILGSFPQLNHGARRICARLKSGYTKIKDVNNSHVGNTIEVRGWVNNFRKQSKFVFLDLKDGSSNEHLQVLVDRETHRQNPGLTYGAAVSIIGQIGTAPRGHLELRAEKLRLNGTCAIEDKIYPFVRKQNHSLDYIRQHLHLRAHNSQFQAFFRARHFASLAFHRHFNDNGFVYIHTPILTSNSCEGAGELLSVVPHNDELLQNMQSETATKPKDEIYFDRKTFLTLSGQMHLEAMCFRLGSVYNFGPVFRAENCNSSIHMSEFYMIEAEESFVESVGDITKRIESTIKSVTKCLLDDNAKEVDEAYKATFTEEKEAQSEEDRFKWLKTPFATVTYAEAAEILQQKYKFNAKDGLSKSDELTLVKHFQKPVFVVNWPRELKPFYMRTCKHDSKLVEAIDFLMPSVGELAGGSVREDSYEVLEPSVPHDLKWYLDLRKYGGCTTGGFGIGFDRYLQVLLGISNIKDTIPFPRWPHHCQM
ncbi:probable asparagine--tRNA ligase, mitochondrial [Sitodiplosis mosellana]|uniref:probable asparagine--tRNA ligase, mitochondrial n=1 Tax=Sitodiplosis mosellana TaxID=263140 RepID=UPI00244482DE|nr:probable asparagine--tRNA ligase, mitochondrial [Sitodiplosis mosellana]